MPHDGIVGPHHHHDDADHDRHHQHHGHPHRTTRRALIGAAASGLVVGLSPRVSRARIVERMTHTAQALVAASDERQRRVLVLPFDAQREDWHYIPRRRAGLPFGTMSAAVSAAAMALLQAGLGETGMRRVEGTRRLEAILRERQGDWRDPDNYAVAIWGVPGTVPWGWRLEGHHLSLNFTVLGPDRVAVTPAFWGANPARANDGFRLMGAVEDAGRGLIRALPDALRREALIAERAFGDIVAGPGRARDIGTPRGLPFARMGAADREAAMRIASGFLEALSPDLAALQTRRLREGGIDELRFAWAGPIADGQPYYFRLHGPVTLIELDNTQNNANHVHSVWRDLAADFGRDMLADHYRRQHR
ncbi:MAG: DUF3500 domain-containing protein [Alphaproteobacteria bacterium]|nr:DUF3500 domain-containing protein [Alphaproteobacteria bacterium]MCW5741878.1 DUF3500 domain-containing protein [Alphaproteobacteria bacterium]